MDAQTSIPRPRLLDFPDISAKWIPVGTAYAVLLGVLYQQAYWSAFGIPVMQYVGWADAVRITIFPLLFIAVVVAMFIAGVALPGKYSPSMIPNPSSSPRAFFLFGVALFLTLAGLLFAILVLIWSDQHPALTAVFFLGCIAGGSVEIHISRSRLRYVRGLFVGLALLGPWGAWTIGTGEAEKVNQLESYRSAILPASVLSLMGVAPSRSSSVIALGHMGEYDFFLTGDRTMVVRSTEVPVIGIQKRSGKTKQERLRIPFRDPIRAPFFN